MSFKGTLVAAFLLTCLFIVACGSEATPTPTQPPPTPTPETAAPAAPTPPPWLRLNRRPLRCRALPPRLRHRLLPRPRWRRRHTAAVIRRGGALPRQDDQLIVGFNPGGGTDTQARFLAANWGRFIPGNPRIVVSNHTPQMAASNFVWKSEPDGTVLQYTAGTLITDSFEPEAEFTVSEFGLIGAPRAATPSGPTAERCPTQTSGTRWGSRTVSRSSKRVPAARRK